MKPIDPPTIRSSQTTDEPEACRKASNHNHERQKLMNAFNISPANPRNSRENTD